MCGNSVSYTWRKYASYISVYSPKVQTLHAKSTFCKQPSYHLQHLAYLIWRMLGPSGRIDICLYSHTFFCVWCAVERQGVQQGWTHKGSWIHEDNKSKQLCNYIRFTIFVQSLKGLCMCLYLICSQTEADDHSWSVLVSYSVCCSRKFGQSS